MLAWGALRKLRSNDYLARTRAKEKLVRARAIKPLIEALGDERSSRIALEAIVEIGDDARQELAGALGASDKRVRSLSAVALARSGDTRSIPVLLATLDDPEADTFAKAESARLLGKLKVDEARDRIRALLNEPELGHSAASALADFGAFEDLLIAAEAGNTSAIRFLGPLGDRRAVDPLVQMLSDSAADRIVVVKVLGELGDERAVEPLLKVFQELRGRIREARPDRYGFMPDWVAPCKRELAEVVTALGKVRASGPMIRSAI
jgi:HEAT repeat protein